MSIVIVDYGMGNLHSVYNAFKRLNIPVVVSGDPKTIMDADKLILPGVGHFKKGMENLRASSIKEALDKKVMEEKVPILGICLGMQLFSKHSEEGNEPGLGWIDANTVRFNFTNSASVLKIPHMGWNNITIVHNYPIMDGVNLDDKYYFVHSYHVKCNDINDVLCTTQYGIEFTSAVQKANIIGMQFHPEKSHKAGLKILQNFIRL
jgi:glutamine amidotransferase